MGSLAEPQGQNKLSFVLDQAYKTYANVHPASKKSHEEACKVLPGGNTRTVLYTDPFPLVIAKGESCYLRTIDGIRYLDFLNEYTAGIFGHNHPIIKDAIQKTVNGGWSYGAHSESEQKLAHLLCERFPTMEMLRFVNSGTEANMMAVATALVVTGKKKILIFQNGYHGSTISGWKSSDKPSINLPHDFVIGKYNNVEDTQMLVSSLPKDSLAAILVEPMLGSGGCFRGTEPFLQTLRQLADNHGALLIFDEVMTSRLGYNGLGAKCDVRPDIMTLGKYLGGGFSFGAFGGRRDIMECYDPRTGKLQHPGTFNNNVFSMNAGIAACHVLDPDTLHRLNDLGDRMQRRIAKVIGHYTLTGEVPDAPIDENSYGLDLPHRPPKMFIKGVGSLMCIHFAGPDQTALAALFYHHMLHHEIYLAQRGFISLSIELRQDHVDLFTAAVESFCQQYKADLVW